MVQVKPEVDESLRRAICERRQIRFLYKGKERISEPHDYGIQNGRALLLTYQVAGQSNSGRLPAWRWIEVTDIESLAVLEKTFDGGRSSPSGRHHRWDQLFARVSTAPQ